jgi:thioredoxin-related protein
MHPIFKRIISSFVLAILFIAPLLAVDGDKTDHSIWTTDFDNAIEIAGQENKLVFVYFSGSDWCRPCMTLKSTILETEQFQSFATDKFVLVKIDFPVKKENLLPPDLKKQNEALAEKYNNNGAFPLILLMNPDGSVVGEISGFNGESVDNYIANLTSMLPNQ